MPMLLHVLVLPLAMALCWAWWAAGGIVQPWGLTALLAGCAVAYAGDRLHDPSPVIDWQPWLRLLLWLSVLAGLGLLLLCAALEGRWLVADVAGLGVLGLGLLAAKRIPLGKELTVALTWALACHALPQGLDLLDAVAARPWAVAWQCGFFAIGTALCDIKDAERDRARGYRNLAALLADGWLRLSACCALVVMVGLAAGLVDLALCAVGIGLLLCCCSRRLLRHALWGPIAVDAALCLIALSVLL